MSVRKFVCRRSISSAVITDIEVPIWRIGIGTLEEVMTTSSIDPCVKQLALYPNKIKQDNLINLDMLLILFSGANEGFQRSNKRERMATASKKSPPLLVLNITVLAGVGLSALLYTVAGAAVGSVFSLPHFPFNLLNKILLVVGTMTMRER